MKYNKHKDNPERNQKDSKLAQTVSGVSVDTNQPSIKETLKYGLGSMYYERMNKKKPDESYKTR